MFKITAALSLIAGFRFFGLFVVMPTLALYLHSLSQDSSLLSALYSTFGISQMAIFGFAISAYAISQIIFQVPFGILGDKYSKRAVIAFGLVIFAIGSLICAFASSIEMMILGRILQGSGAIGSVISAKITDLISEEKRGGAMAFMGICIFISFIIAMIAGPLIGAHFGTDKLFLLTAFLALLAIIPLFTIVPKAPHLEYFGGDKESYFKLFKNKNLMILNLSVAVQKFLMTFAFVLVPVVLVGHLGMAKENIWIVFSLSAVAGIFSIPPSMIIAERKKLPKEMLLFSIVLFAVAFALMGFGDSGKSLVFYALGVIIFFSAFCISEPILQNLASKYPKMRDKSLSLGIFTTFGFIGSFLGGIVAGCVYEMKNADYVVAVAMIAWFALMLMLKNPRIQENLYIRLDSAESSVDSADSGDSKDSSADSADSRYKSIAEINKMEGVIESYINNNENLLVVKFDNTQISKDELMNAIKA